MPKVTDISPAANGVAQIQRSESLREAAVRISHHAREMLDGGYIEPIEAVGHESLATLLDMYADGDLPKEFAITLLKSLAEKKTPNPVQKIEQTHKVDINVVLSRIVQDSPEILTHTLELAETRKLEVMKRLKVGTNLALPVVTPTNTSNMPANQMPAEPIEIFDIRDGGDGSAKRNAPLQFDEDEEKVPGVAPGKGYSFVEKAKI